MARVVAELVKFKGAWVTRRVDEPSGDVLFVRKSSLRDKAQFSALQVGSRISRRGAPCSRSSRGDRSSGAVMHIDSRVIYFTSISNVTSLWYERCARLPSSLKSSSAK